MEEMRVACAAVAVAEAIDVQAAACEYGEEAFWIGCAAYLAKAALASDLRSGVTDGRDTMLRLVGQLYDEAAQGLKGGM